MFVSKKPSEPNANPNVRVTPNATPNTSRWNIVAFGNIRVGFTLGMSISRCLFPFLPVLLPNANAVSGGIWASNHVLDKRGDHREW